MTYRHDISSSHHLLKKRRPCERSSQTSFKQDRYNKSVHNEDIQSIVVDLTTSHAGNSHYLNTNTSTSCTPAKLDITALKSKKDVPRASFHLAQIDHTALRADKDDLRGTSKADGDDHRIYSKADHDASAPRKDNKTVPFDLSRAGEEASAIAARLDTNAPSLDSTADRADTSDLRVETSAFARADLEDANADDIPLFYECGICERRFVHHDSFIAHKVSSILFCDIGKVFPYFHKQ